MYFQEAEILENNEATEDNNNEKVFLGDKKIISGNKKTEEMIKEYKEKNKVRRHFTQKKPLNK